MSDCTPELRQLIHDLEGQLRETQRRLEGLRRERRVAPSVVFGLMVVTALTATLSTGRLRAQTNSKVVAPFVVVDQTGRELLTVTEEDGRPVLHVGNTFLGTGASGGGFLTIHRPNNNMALSLGQRNGQFGFRVLGITGDTELAVMGESKAGGGVLVANDGSGKTRMLVSGTGQIHAVDQGGITRATMTSDGAFSIRNAAGTTVARLGESPGGQGMFQLANSGGNAIVESGMLATGAGIVRTYPNGGPMGGLIGMPGTFIMGFISAKK